MKVKRLMTFLIIINMTLTISINNILFAYNEPIITDPVSGERIYFEIPGYGPAYINNYGWNQPYFGGYQQSYFQPPFPYGYPKPFYGWNQPFGWNQPYNPYGYQQPPYGYYQPPTLANDFGGPYFWDKQFNNPYGVGYQQPSYYPYGYGETFNPYGYQQAYPYSSLTYEQLWNTGLPTFLSSIDPRMAIAYVGPLGLGLDPYIKNNLIPGAWGEY